MYILTLVFSNAINECHRNFFLVSVDETQYCYWTKAELQFASNRLLSSKEVQQSDSLSPLLFSLDLPTR